MTGIEMLSVVAVLGAVLCWFRLTYHTRHDAAWRLQREREWHALLEAFRATQELHGRTVTTASSALDVRIRATEAMIEVLQNKVHDLDREVVVMQRRALRPPPPQIEEGAL